MYKVLRNGMVIDCKFSPHQQSIEQTCIMMRISSKCGYKRLLQCTDKYFKAINKRIKFESKTGGESLRFSWSFGQWCVVDRNRLLVSSTSAVPSNWF